MPEKILPASAVQKFYDRIGTRYDWFDFYEGRAKGQALKALQLEAGINVLSVGVGTGKELARIKEQVSPGGTAVGLDLSTGMARLARERVGATICQADVRQMPFAASSYHRLYAGYVLDLLPFTDLEQLLNDFWRVLLPDSKLVILALTEGVDLPSKALISIWKGVFNLSPAICGGCRPLELFELVDKAGFTKIKRQVIVQAGVPSELIHAYKN
jgi:demethylmenaquinone methyltransferase/2-methoxy-6-polyprenyl-1,4-benzoquinol methylase